MDNSQRGNALLYVLIAIALFAALNFTLTRQTDTGESGSLPDEKADLYATQLISYAAQAKSVLDQMMFGGSDIGAMDFTLPNQPGFNTGSAINRVYHPAGGGLNPGRLPAEITTGADSDPVAGWYLGRFNNVEWTKTTATDVILVAYQIKKAVCEKLNLKITGSATIPVLGAAIDNVMIDDSIHNGTNVDFTTDPDAGSPICAECHKLPSLCVQSLSPDAYAFYTVIADR
ncbi:MAG: hypothetical protein K9G62_03590 [Alphaproteobacteria bacterium]|nr:hypothetical protein [Alphaproteobacteria bacterium]